MSFTKLFQSITASTIWCEDHATRIVWVTMLAMVENENGYVGASVPGLAAAARVTVEECEVALAKFRAPDKYSRTKEHEGRRIVDADGGWILLNYAKYRSKSKKEERQEQNRAAAKRKRDRDREERLNEPLTNADASAGVTVSHQQYAESAQAEAEAEAERSPVAPLRGSEPELEPGEPEREESSYSLVRRRFTARFERARANPPGWGHKQVEHARALAAWLDATGGDAAVLLERLLDAFFRDAWAAEKAFPLGALAGNPSKYLSGPSAPLPVRSGPVHGLNAAEDV